jgi:hypothetical protein
LSYITFKNIATSGDLGSQILQYFSLYAVAKENNKTIVFPESIIDKGWGFKFCNLLDIEVSYKSDDFFKDFISIKMDPKLLRDPSLFSLDKNTNYNIDELFYLFHYWHPKYSNDIMNFSWNKNYQKEADLLYQKIKVPNKELVSIHVRRGDYLLPQHHHFCQLDTEYYSKAIEPFIDEIEKYHFVIFSNDIEWCKNNLIEGDMVTFIDPNSDYVDLLLMSMCDHNIIANSTYSWCAAYKNKNRNKKVICPKNYVKSYSAASFLNGNYYPNTWKNIDNKL